MILPELYNPMLDAPCFNDKYKVPAMNTQEVYADYEKLFEWGLENQSESFLFGKEDDVTHNRFPGMCLRTIFHDNAIVDEDGADYVARHIDEDVDRSRYDAAQVGR